MISNTSIDHVVEFTAPEVRDRCIFPEDGSIKLHCSNIKSFSFRCAEEFTLKKNASMFKGANCKTETSIAAQIELLSSTAI